MCVNNFSLRRACALGAILSTIGVSFAQAQPASITATAAVKGADGTSRTAPLTLVIRKYATDAERDALLAAVKGGGTAAARALLAKRDDVGTLQVGEVKAAIKYAYARPTGSGHLVTIVTADPLHALGAGKAGAKSTEGFDLGLVLADVPGSGAGHGELAPAAKIRVDEKGAIVTEDYGSEVVRLTNVVKK